MKRRVALWMFGLFRPRTRNRYRDEFNDLVDELVNSGHARRGLWLDVASAGVRDRAAGLRGTGRLAVVGTIVVIAALVLATRALVEMQSPSNGSTAVAVVRPFLIPTGPQASTASCPSPPRLSSPLPLGATVSIASLVPGRLSVVTAAGVAYDLTSWCQYTLTLSPS